MVIRARAAVLLRFFSREFRVLMNLAPPTNDISPRCLLCSSAGHRVVWTLRGSDVRQLWAEFDRSFSEEAYGRLKPDTLVEQFECMRCGFRFFDPRLAGGARFYEEMKQGSYYSKWRPEFGFTVDLARRSNAHTILDVGAGDGDFLDHARTAGFSTLAMELNTQAAAVCGRKGHRTITRLLHEVTVEELGGRVDILTLFQVVEHVPDPRGFLRQAARLVRPGGLIVVSVPNNRGQHILFPFDPANMPPHHVSRWRKRDLRYLGEQCGMNLCAEGADILYGKSMAEFWRYQNRLALAIGKRPYPGGSWVPTLVSWLYKKSGMRFWGPRAGLSIYTAYRTVA